MNAETWEWIARQLVDAPVPGAGDLDRVWNLLCPEGSDAHRGLLVQCGKSADGDGQVAERAAS